MAIARNWNYTTIQVPSLSPEQAQDVANYIAELQAQNKQEAVLTAVVTSAVLAAMQATGAQPRQLRAGETPRTTAREVELKGVDEQTAAMVMAIVCAQMQKQPAQLVFNSIKAL